MEERKQPEFILTERVAEQLRDARLGPLSGKLNQERLNALLNNLAAQRTYDTLYDTINVVQEVEAITLRITVLRDSFLIISVGPIRMRNITNGIVSGRFAPLQEQ